MSQYTGSTNRVVSWNVKVGRNHNDMLNGLQDIIDNTNPDVICLQEAGGYMGDLRDRFKPKWFVYAHNDWDEANDNPVMVKKDGNHSQKNRGQKDGWDTLRTDTKWTGPQGGTHTGRTWTWVKVSGLWVMSYHRCTDGDGKNKAEFKQEYEKTKKWIGNHIPCLIIGDHNVGSGKDGSEYPFSSRQIATDANGGVDASGSIDYGIQKSANGTCVEKGKHGSDHAAVLWTLGT